MVRARIPVGIHRCSGQACSDGGWVDEAGAAVVDCAGQQGVSAFLPAAFASAYDVISRQKTAQLIRDRSRHSTSRAPKIRLIH